MIEQKSRRELRDFSQGKCFCSFCRDASPDLEKEYNSVWLRASHVEHLLFKSGLGNDAVINYLKTLFLCKSSDGQENSPNCNSALDEHREAGGGCKEGTSISFRSPSPVINPYVNIKETHRVVGEKVCCVNHYCDWHYRSVEEFDKECKKTLKKCTCEIPTLRNGIKGYCVSCGGGIYEQKKTS